MRVVIAPNSFKNCLDAATVAESLASGVRTAVPEAELDLVPLSDGGDGLVSVLTRKNASVIRAETTDPLGRRIEALWLKTDRLAVIESAQASGLSLLQGASEYKPMKASSFGTGLLIKAAIEAGCREIIVGLGGSATVDAGCGAASALGFRLEDSFGRGIELGGGGLLQLERIEQPDPIPAWLKDIEFTVLADVLNPLLGESGAARMFAPQKGATPSEVEQLELALARWAAIAERDLGKAVASIPGAGAAGGMGAGFAAFLGAKIESGAFWVMEQLDLSASLKRADILFTGEGRLDSQTGLGKAPARAAKLAKALGKSVVFFAGSLENGLDQEALGIDVCVQVTPDGMGLEEALRTAGANLEKAAAEVAARMKGDRKNWS